MRKPNPTRSEPPAGEARPDDPGALPDTRPPLKDPRSISAIDNIGVDTPGDLLDAELDDEPGDDTGKRPFTQDVRSDRNDDEHNERR
jgi:hypothetical protein